MAKHISVKGVVQGVGFRPFVYGLATRLDLHGWVCNTSGGVEILVDGQSSNLEKFVQSLSLEKPPLAKIDSIQVDEAPCDSSSSFEIHVSQNVEGAYQPISPGYGNLSRLRTRTVRSERQALSISVHQLHSLWTTLYDYQGYSV